MAKFGKPVVARPKANAARIAQWFASGKGQRLLGCGQQLLSPQLERMFGSYALLYNHYHTQPWTTGVKRQVRLGQVAQAQDINCTEDSWPVQPDSVDLVVLQHSLEFAASAHDLLHEAAQAVRPGGHVVIVAINPYSCFAIGRLFGKKPWRQAKCYSAARVEDWLTLLGFQLERRSYNCYRPLAWLKDAASMSALERHMYKKQLPLGNCYMLVARKMRPGSFTQARRKLALEQLIPLPTATASRTGSLDQQQHDD